MDTNKIKVLIADDHAIVRMGLSTLLGTEDDIDVVGEASNGLEAVRESLRLKPNVVIMDILMPRKDGITAARELRERAPEIKILILTSAGTPDDIQRALDAGASGIVLKSADNQDVTDAIRQIVAEEQPIISREIRRLLRQDPPAPELSNRQQEILAALTRGLTNEDIAKQLDIALPSVKTHLARVFAKIGAANRAEAVAIALRKHLLKI